MTIAVSDEIKEKPKGAKPVKKGKKKTTRKTRSDKGKKKSIKASIKKPYTPPDVETQEDNLEPEDLEGLPTSEVARLCDMQVSNLNGRVSQGLIKPSIRESKRQGSGALWHKDQVLFIQTANRMKDFNDKITLKEYHDASRMIADLQPDQAIFITERGIHRVSNKITVGEIRRWAGRWGFMVFNP